MLLPFSEPSVSNILKLLIVDYDKTDSDDLIGSMYIDKKHFDQYSEFKWINIYGS